MSGVGIFVCGVAAGVAAVFAWVLVSSSVGQRRMHRDAEAWRARQWADIEAGIVPEGQEPSMMFEAYWADGGPSDRETATGRAAETANGWLAR